MSDEPKIDPEVKAEAAPAEEEGPKKPQIEWEYKTEFGINARMREIIDTTIKVAEAEIATYKRKIERLTYGS